MASLNKWKLRNKLLEVVRSNELVDLGKAMRAVGYSYNYSLQPSRVMKSITMYTVIEELDAEIKRIQVELKNKDLSKERYDTLIRGIDIQIKNKQLLSGGATERVFTVEVSEAIAKKNDSNSITERNS